MKKIFLIDGHSLLNRAFYALPLLTNAQGEPTNAVYGFTMMLFRLLEDYHPDGVFVAFDVSKPTFRHKQYAEYKATRKGMPDELRPQVALLKDVLDALGIPRLELAGYEADDIIGTAAKKGESLGCEVYIITGDKDSLQLVSDQTTVLLTKRGIKETELVDVDKLASKYQLTPDQVRDLKGLMGDSSDNIPGVPGIGEKTGLKLLSQYKSLEEVYEHLEDQKGKLKERLTDHKDQAFLSKELATIDCQVPLEIDLKITPEPNLEQAYQLFQRLEFNTLLEKVKPEGNKGEASEGASQSSLEFQLHTVSTDTAGEFFAAIKEERHIAVDYLLQDGELDHVALAFNDEVWLIDRESPTGAWEYLKDELATDRELYFSDAKGWYLKFLDAKVASAVKMDTAIAGYLLDPASSQELASLAKRYGDMPDLAVTDDTLQALANRSHVILKLTPYLLEALAENELTELFTEVELPLVWVIAKMESRGILVDPDTLREMSYALNKTLTRLTEEIHEIAGESFNINSPKQLGVILFDKLGLPVIKKTKTGPSTSAEVLEKLGDHEIVAKILEYRQVAKLKSTYTDALAELINPETKRIHTTFNQTVTATGRLSSTNPNLQNIPIRRVEGRNIRKAFVASEGFQLLAADYSQIELRVLAHIAQDEKMIEAFSSGIDIHTRTASEVLGIELCEVTKEQRSAAKAINFGIIYGISSFGLSKGTNLSRKKAQEYIDNYFERYPKVKQYLDGIVKQAKSQGYVTTLLNRRRYLPEITSRNFARRSFAERTAMNTPIQGSAADIIKLAMLRVEEALAGYASRLLLQVHDELVLEVAEDEFELVVPIIKQAMEGVLKISVPLDVDMNTGKNWRDVQPVEIDEVS